MNYLLLLGANQFQRERVIIGVARAFRGPIVVCSTDPLCVPNNFADYTIFVENESDPKCVLDAVILFNKKFEAKPIFVIPINDFVLDSSLAVANLYNCNTNGENTIRIAREKDLMKMQFSKHSVPHAESLRCENFQDLVENSLKIGSWPQVIKPVNFGGSGGVVKVDSGEELKSAYDYTIGHLEKYARKFNSFTDRLLIEKYIPHKDEISVEVLNTPCGRKVLGITKKFLGPEPYFAEIGHLACDETITNLELRSKIENTAILACESLNIRFGLAHVEMKLNYESLEICVVEVGARPAGDGILDLWEKVTGENFYSYHCLSYMGLVDLKKIDLTYKSVAAIGYFCPDEGQVSEISPLKDIIMVERFIEKISVRCEVGQTTFKPKDWSTRYGFVNFLLSKDSFARGSFDLIEETEKVTKKVFSIRPTELIHG